MVRRRLASVLHVSKRYASHEALYGSVLLPDTHAPCTALSTSVEHQPQLGSAMQSPHVA